MVVEIDSSSAADWLAAAGTIGAVVFAIFAGPVRRWWTRPRLSLSHSGRDNHVEFDKEHEILDRKGQEADALYVRPAVTNQRRKRTAEGVEVVVARAESLDEPGQVVHLPSPGLGWTSSLEDATRRTIGPGMTRTLDLGYARDNRTWGGDVRFRLLIAVRPNNLRHHLSAGNWRLHVDLVAQNADASRYQITITVDKDWSDDCVKVTQLAEIGARSIVA